MSVWMFLHNIVPAPVTNCAAAIHSAPGAPLCFSSARIPVWKDLWSKTEQGGGSSRPFVHPVVIPSVFLPMNVGGWKPSPVSRIPSWNWSQPWRLSRSCNFSSSHSSLFLYRSVVRLVCIPVSYLSLLQSHHWPYRSAEQLTKTIPALWKPPISRRNVGLTDLPFSCPYAHLSASLCHRIYNWPRFYWIWLLVNYLYTDWQGGLDTGTDTVMLHVCYEHCNLYTICEVAGGGGGLAFSVSNNEGS